MIILEMPPSYEYYLYKFFKNEPIKDQYLFAKNDKFYIINSYLKKLYERGTIIKCIDLEIPNYFALGTLYELVPVLEPEPKIAETFSMLKEIQKGYKLNDIKIFVEYVRKDIGKKEQYYKQYLKDNFQMFKRIIDGLEIGLEFKHDSEYTTEILTPREIFMYGNILNLLKENPEKKVIGVFGKVHVIKDSVACYHVCKNWNSLAARLNNNSESPVKGKVLSIVATYRNEFANKKYCYLLTKDEYKLFYKNSKSLFTIYNLNDFKGVIKDTYSNYFDYILLSKARKPWW